MKKLALAAAFSLAATSAFAGNLSDPIIEEPVIAEETASTAGGVLIPVLFLVLAAAAASS